MLEVLDQFRGNSFVNFKRKYFTKDFLVKTKNQWNFKCNKPQKNQNGKKGKNIKKKQRNRIERKKERKV